MVLIVFKGEMFKKGLGGGCLFGYIVVINNKNSDNIYYY